MLSLLFTFLAAICNSVMDLLENENFSSSIFRNKNRTFWYKRESWKYAKKIFGWKFDGWHIFKSLTLILLFLAIVFYKPILNHFLLDIILLGSIWNITFGIFYKLFKTKKNDERD